MVAGTANVTNPAKLPHGALPKNRAGPLKTKINCVVQTPSSPRKPWRMPAGIPEIRIIIISNKGAPSKREKPRNVTD